MNTEFAIANVLPGRLNALVKNIMRQTGTDDPNEAVRLVNSGAWIATRVSRWSEEDGIVYTYPHGQWLDAFGMDRIL